VIPRGGGEARRITAMNAEKLLGIARSKVEEVTYPGAGGTPVHMFVAYPPDFDPSKKWPAILILHGGPHGAWKDEYHYRWSAALFAAKGWIALLPNFHGSTGYGQAFAEAIVGAHGDKPFQDVMRGVDTMVAKGFVDERRLVAAGGSYGGYLAAWLLGKTDRFAAIVNHAGVYDLMSQFASDSTYGRSNNYGATPWEDAARIDRWSPSRFASGFKTPTLVLHGERDYRVPYTQGLNLHGVLTAKGVPSRLVVFPNENHWILKPQAARIWWSEVFGWMDRWAGPAGS
jgi:dipeptidyl aminopeptidase/acylaminoacyl peptidase